MALLDMVGASGSRGYKYTRVRRASSEFLLPDNADTEITEMTDAAPLESAFKDKVDVTVRPVRKRTPWWRLGGTDYSHVAVDDTTESESSSLSEYGSSGLVKSPYNVYADSDAAELYKPIEGYEGSHRFDPSATWTEQQEKALLRKVCTSLQPL